MTSDSQGQRENLPAPIRRWAMACHLSALIGLLLPLGAFGLVIGPLLLWLFLGSMHPYVAEHGREATNFQLTVVMFGLLTLIFTTQWAVIYLGFITLLSLSLAVWAAMQAVRGKRFRYPINLRPFRNWA